MKKDNVNSRCPLCGGQKTEGKTTYTVDMGAGVIVIRNVPAMVCDQCGEEWIRPEIAGRLESLVEESRQKKLQVEVVAL